MNTVYDHPAFPYPLKREIERWLDENAADERKKGETQEQFLYKTRKKAIGPYKEQVWNLPEGTRGRDPRDARGEVRVPLREAARPRHARHRARSTSSPCPSTPSRRGRGRARRLRARRPGGRLRHGRETEDGRRRTARSRSHDPGPTMTAVVKTKAAPGPRRDRDPRGSRPEPGQAEVLIRVLATAVCGSDKHIYQWDASMAGMFQPPRIYGHEFCGEIVAFGPGRQAAAPRGGPVRLGRDARHRAAPAGPA